MKKIVLFVLSTILVIPIAGANIIKDIQLMKKVTKCEIVTQNVNTTTIPFTIEKGWLVIKVTVQYGNKSPEEKKFIFDTGAITQFETGYIHDKGWDTKSISMSQVAVAEEAKRREAFITDKSVLFTLGDIQVMQPNVMINKINAKSFKCTDAAGLIGSNLLSKFVVSIDFKNSLLTLTKKAAFDYNQLGNYTSELPFLSRLFQNNPAIDININGQQFNGIFDTGMTNELVLQVDSTKDFFTSLVSNPKVLAYDAYAVLDNANGVVKKNNTIYQWPNANFTGKKGNTFHTDISVLPASENTFYLGLQFMSTYEKVIIDWNKEYIYFFNPAAESFKSPSEVRIRHFTSEQKFVIAHVQKKSSLYANGLRGGDEVLRINNTNLANLGIPECDMTDKLNQLLTDIDSITVKRDNKDVVILK